MELQEGLRQLAQMSNQYGSDENYVLAGGGNTSYKDEKRLYIKPSGVTLSDIQAEDFVEMNREKLYEMLHADYPKDDDRREALSLQKMMDAVVIPGSRRPSVETPLHNLFPFRFVLHLHPALLNGLTCGQEGEAFAKNLFGDACVWVELTKPGFMLASLCQKRLAEEKQRTGKDAQILILQNHGVFYAADTVAEMEALNQFVMEKIKAQIKEWPNLEAACFDTQRVAALAPAIRMLFMEEGKSIVNFICTKTVAAFVETKEAFAELENPFSPDHIVYCKAFPLWVPFYEDLEMQFKALQNEYAAYIGRNGYKPKVVAVEKLGVFVCGADVKGTKTTKALFLDAVKVAVYSRSFGGAHAMDAHFVDFIVNWEIENYRIQISRGSGQKKRLTGKIALITGGAQGFGRGIAQEMAEEGAFVVIADLNEAGAKTAAEELNALCGKGRCFAVGANVSDEDSVRQMIEQAVLQYGGLDLLVSNAGIVRAGGLDAMKKADFELVTAINYTGYFLCAKYASAVMKIQHRFAPDYYMDMIEVNSKSGLAGSSKNFAYAGSKFGGIGLTQSFALELAPEKIKVNAICPGNFLDGPLWSDPETGLFRQYLEAGKVEGAKTVEDVKKHYESKVPLQRGCQVKDVARAVFYIVEQEYETGQAVPVTGGQEMLR